MYQLISSIAAFIVYAISCYLFATSSRVRRDISGLRCMSVAAGISALVDLINICLRSELLLKHTLLTPEEIRIKYVFVPFSVARVLIPITEYGNWISLIAGFIGIIILNRSLCAGRKPRQPTAYSLSPLTEIRENGEITGCGLRPGSKPRIR